MYIQSLSIGWFRLIDSAAYIIGDPGVNKISDELHDAAVGISMVQGGGSDGTLEDVDDNTAAQQLTGLRWTNLKWWEKIEAYLNACYFCGTSLILSLFF